MSDNDKDDNLKELRQQAEAGRKAQAEAEAARRELAFIKAGVDTDSKLGQLLMKTYDGELTAEAIKAEAEELGAIKAPASAPPAQDELSDEERAQTRARNDLAAGNTATGAEEPDPHKTGFAAFEAARHNGEPRDVAAGAYLAEILKAAHARDPRVIVP